MAVSMSYPGVYVQEEPSGVRTIAGVSTSIAAFVGRARKGPMYEPTLCLSFSDFERIFSSQFAGSDLARSVRLFFQNGGTRCYVTRIADNTAAPAEVTLRNENQTPTLTVRARSEGTVGDSIRLTVKYNALQPEATFDMEVFQWQQNSGGVFVKSEVETYQNLSMDPDHARYAEDVINQNSSLVEVEDLELSPAAEGFSQSGRAVAARTDTIFRNTWSTLIGSGSSTNRFRISVDNGPFVDVDLSSIDFSHDDLDTATEARSNLAGFIEDQINLVLPAGASVNASFVDGPVGPSGEDLGATVYLRIASSNGDVRIRSASQNDLALPLMLGTTQGGVEFSRHALSRPTPTGNVFDLNLEGSPSNLVEFGQLEQTAFDTITVDGQDIDLASALQTNTDFSDSRMFQDGESSTARGNSDGVREKWNLIASRLNEERASNPDFTWSAEVWGQRLAILPQTGNENRMGTLSTGGADGVDLGPGGEDMFLRNVRFYSLVSAGQGDYQEGGQGGVDGGAPSLPNYRDAFAEIEKNVDLFNLMILPRDHDHTEEDSNQLWGPASTFCQEQRAFLLMDPPTSWDSVQDATDPSTGVNSLRLGLVNDHAAVFYPRLTISEEGRQIPVGPSGAIAGLMARIDGNRGVWKAPAGTEATLRGVVGLQDRLSDRENGVLNPKAVNALRIFPEGIVNWGARTMDGDDGFGSEYKYIPVRRLALFMEESLYRGLQWVVFEPNDEGLWSQIRLNVGAFMHNLFREGAFQGQTPSEAYFVRCDSETTTQNDIDLGRVNIWVGFAPLKPAEFVILHIQQKAGQIET